MISNGEKCKVMVERKENNLVCGHIKTYENIVFYRIENSLLELRDTSDVLYVVPMHTLNEIKIETA